VKVPAGVREVVSLALPTPCFPIRADTGPSFTAQPFGPFSQAVTFAVVAEADAATTVITCVELPVVTASGRTAPVAAADRPAGADVGAGVGAGRAVAGAPLRVAVAAAGFDAAAGAGVGVGFGVLGPR
jgi:hypothetical protein